MKKTEIVIASVLIIFGISLPLRAFPYDKMGLLGAPTRDDNIVYIGKGSYCLSKVVVVDILPHDRVRSGYVGLLHLRMSSPVLRRGGVEMAGFRMLRPVVNVSGGRVARLVCETPSSNTEVTASQEVTAASVYVMDIEFDGDVPDEISIQMNWSSDGELQPGDELTFGVPYVAGMLRSVPWDRCTAYVKAFSTNDALSIDISSSGRGIGSDQAISYAVDPEKTWTITVNGSGGVHRTTQAKYGENRRAK